MGREPLWRHVVGGVLRRERLAQERTLKDVAEAARISMPYLSELERGRKEASSEVLAAAARALGLGLAELLSLAQGELARAGRARRGRGDVAPGGAAGRRPGGPDRGHPEAGAEAEAEAPASRATSVVEPSPERAGNHRATTSRHDGLCLAA